MTQASFSHAVFFPGQGAQKVGMAADLVERDARARAVFDRGREILGIDLLAICRDGPREDLSSTRLSQPAIFLHSMAVLELLNAGPFGTELPAQATAGLSLGEYSALVFAGSLSFEDALRLVARRGEAMQAACDQAAGAMAAVLGLDPAMVERVVDDERRKGLEIGCANFNSPVETVISGERGAVETVSAALKEAGARRVVPLDVAGAYHSPLMAPATREMAPLIEAVEIRPPRLPFYANVSGDRVTDPEEIRRGLIAQIESPVRFSGLVRAMIDRGDWTSARALELGPGRVIQGLARKIDAGLHVEPIGASEDLDKSEVLPL
ncbi:MAG TPA: ACP S-malonyltransferase [Planctomycetota bacterium]|nr:ACP S-malonyltransferase [Planctomycetota bacterium]